MLGGWRGRCEPIRIQSKHQ